MPRASVLVALACGCGRIDFDPAEIPFAVTLDTHSSLYDLAALPDGSVLGVGWFVDPLELRGVAVPSVGGLDGLVVHLEGNGAVRAYQTYGSSADDMIWSVAVAPDGTSAIGGWTYGSFSIGNLAVTNHGDEDGFVAVFDADGTPRWARAIGGNNGITPFGADFVNLVRFAPNGDLVVAGSVLGPVDFGDGNVLPGKSLAPDGYVAVYAGADGSLRWARRYGVGGSAQNYNEVRAVAVGADGTIYASGYYTGAVVFDGATADPVRGNEDAFAIALDANGNHLWHRSWGGPGFEYGDSIAVHGTTAIVGGFYEDSSDLPGVPTAAGGLDALVIAFDQTGAISWLRHDGSTGCDRIYAVRDDVDRILVTGGFSDTIDFGDGPRVANGTDGLIGALSPTDGSLLWLTTFDGGPADFGHGVDASPTGGIFAAGVVGSQPGCVVDQTGAGYLQHAM